MLIKRFKTVLLLLLIFGVSFAQKITSPKDFLGFSIGEDRKLADTQEIFAYFHKISEQSDRILLKNLGKTTMGNDFLLAIISSEDNIKNIDRILEIQQKLADPRKVEGNELEELIACGKSIVEINCSIHSTEIAATQLSMKLAYDLISSEDEDVLEILKNVILLLVPIHNPDGHQMVVDWYEKYIGTKYEGCRMPWLYHKYVGHDINRDWYYFSQAETRLTVEKIYNIWHPMVIVDMHQMGSTGARLFVPPFTDPIEPNVDPILVQNINIMGTYIAGELISKDKGGVVFNTIFDAWSPSRAYMHYHGGIRILTETASANIATPINIDFNDIKSDYKKTAWNFPLLWEGGEWKIKDILDYEYIAAMGMLKNVSNNREYWLRSFYNVGKNALNYKKEPYAYVIPLEQKSIPEMIKMLKVLRIGDVEIHIAKEDFRIEGYKFKKGTFIIYSAQPYGSFARALLSAQKYPEIRLYENGPLKRPYDATAHNLPLLMGVNVIEVKSQFDVNSEKIDEIRYPEGKLMVLGTEIFGFINRYKSNFDALLVNRLLKEKISPYWLASDIQIDNEKFNRGSIFIPYSSETEILLKNISDELPVNIKSVSDKFRINGFKINKSRIGLYKGYTASMDEGWTRWVLDQYEFGYESLFGEDIRKGNLNKRFDVIIIPDISGNRIINGISEKYIPPEYSGGIGEVGLNNLKKFLEKGGSIVGLNGASDFLIKNFWLNVSNVVERIDKLKFYIPGSILKILLNENHPIAFGLDREINGLFYYSPIFETDEGQVVGKYPPSNPLLSGWLEGEKYVINKSAIVETNYGDGKIILIGFKPQYRGQSEDSFRILFNSIFYSNAELKTIK